MSANQVRAIERSPDGPDSAQGSPGAVEQCRVALLIGDVVLEFRASLRQGLNFTEALRHWSSRYLVLLDREVRPDLPLLPCGRLWD
jgi:hypothetical protein